MKMGRLGGWLGDERVEERGGTVRTQGVEWVGGGAGEERDGRDA